MGIHTFLSRFREMLSDRDKEHTPRPSAPPSLMLKEEMASTQGKETLANQPLTPHTQAQPTASTTLKSQKPLSHFGASQDLPAIRPRSLGVRPPLIDHSLMRRAFQGDEHALSFIGGMTCDMNATTQSRAAAIKALLKVVEYGGHSPDPNRTAIQAKAFQQLKIAFEVALAESLRSVRSLEFLKSQIRETLYLAVSTVAKTETIHQDHRMSALTLLEMSAQEEAAANRSRGQLAYQNMIQVVSDVAKGRGNVSNTFWIEQIALKELQMLLNPASSAVGKTVILDQSLQLSIARAFASIAQAAQQDRIRESAINELGNIVSSVYSTTHEVKELCIQLLTSLTQSETVKDQETRALAARQLQILADLSLT